MLEGSKRKWWSDKWDCSYFNLLWQSCPGPQSKLSQQRRTLCHVIYPLLEVGDLFVPSQPWGWLNSSNLLMNRSSGEFSHKTCCCWKTWIHPNQNPSTWSGLVSLNFQSQWRKKKKKKIGGDKTPNNQNMLVEHLLKRHLLFVQNNFLCYLIKFWKVSFQFLSFLSQLFHGDVQTKHFNWEKLLFFFLFVCQHIAFLGIFTPVQQNTRFQHL